MRRIATTGLLAAALCVAWGCSKSEENAGAPAAPAAPQVPPHSVVFQFLESVRTGNDKGAEAMLTDMAREKTRAMDLMVAPPGSPTAKFEVGATEIAEQGQLAYVESRWTDVGPDGKPEVNDFVWAMRLDKGFWRIGGVATQPFPGMDFIQLDFENPEDMVKQTQLAEQEYQRRLNGGKAAGTVAGATTAGATVAGNTANGAATAETSSPDGLTQQAVGSTPTLNPTPNGLTSGTPTLPGGPVQNAGGIPTAGNNGGVQPVSGFSSGTSPSGNAPLQAQQPALPGDLQR